MSKTQRQRQRRGKLSRRMKKRGGGPKSSLKKLSASASPSASASNRKVYMSPIVQRELVGRAPFLEPIGVVKPALNDPPALNEPTRYTKIGPNTEFTIGSIKYTVNTELDKEKQREGFDIFNDSFISLQNHFIKRLNADQLTAAHGHDGNWICVRAGNGQWNPKNGSWKMLPEKFNCDETVNDEILKSDDGKTMILRKNAAGVFCLPKNYKLILMVPPDVPVID